MSTYRSVKVVALAALVFAAWEIVDHYYLMGMEVFEYHVIGFIVETVLASTAILWFAGANARATAQQARAEVLAAAVAEVLGSEQVETSPVVRLMKTLDEVETSAANTPELQSAFEKIRKEARRIQAAHKGLTGVLSPRPHAQG